MKTTKTFDCVRMKDGIQAKLLKQWRDVPQEDVRRQIEEHLAASNSDLAKWWRSIPSNTIRHPR